MFRQEISRQLHFIRAGNTEQDSYHNKTCPEPELMGDHETRVWSWSVVTCPNKTHYQLSLSLPPHLFSPGIKNWMVRYKAKWKLRGNSEGSLKYQWKNGTCYVLLFYPSSSVLFKWFSYCTLNWCSLSVNVPNILPEKLVLTTILSNFYLSNLW